MNKNGTELLRDLCLAFGPSGFEGDVRELIRPRAEAVADRVTVDKMGDLIALMQFGDVKAQDRKKIMISAHMDEVGFLVKSIEKFILFVVKFDILVLFFKVEVLFVFLIFFS